MAHQKTLPWHSFGLEESNKHLRTNFEKGLTNEEAVARLRKYGANTFGEIQRESIFLRVFTQFKNPLVAMLLIGFFATLVFKEYLDMTVILAALCINVIVSIIQEARAGKAFEKLVSSQERTAQVMRDGEKKLISARDLVLGDIIFLETGTRVPADARIIDERDLSFDESALTGESMETEKAAGTLPLEMHIAERTNMAWMGTLAVSGRGKAVVVATGERTEMGDIAISLNDLASEATPLQKSIHRLAKTLAIIAAGATALIFALGIMRGHQFSEMVLMAVSVGIAAMPEGLPVAVTVTLIIGMEAILRRGGLVRNLLAAETLGSTTIILTDKTGTLTKAEMEVAQTIAPDHLVSEKKHAAGVSGAHDEQILTMAILASDAFVEGRESPLAEWVVRGRPVERAIVRAGLESGIDPNELFRETPRIDFMSFQSERRFGASLHKGTSKTMRHLFVTGAPEFLLASSSFVHIGDKRVKLTGAMRKDLEAVMRRESAAGMRLIAVSYKNVTWEKLPHESDPNLEKEMLGQLTFGGIIALHDPLRPDARTAIETAQKAGTRVIMLTGDNKETALAIAEKAGIAPQGSRAVTGDEVEKMTDSELLHALREISVFARVLPHQKLRIARILKGEGEVVAMTGDGVNDAPALRAADIGVALGGGTEVAKEASDLVLLDGSFSVIVAAIEEGRRILDNLKKIVSYLVSTSMSEVFIVGGALVVGAPLPLLSSQIIWTKIVEEGFMNFAFAFEPKEDNLMRRNPQSSSMRTILTPKVKRLILLMSVITGVFLIGLYFTLLAFGMSIEKARTLMFIAISIDSIFFALSLKNLHKPIWRIPIFSNRYLVFALIGSIGALILALVLPPLQKLLAIVPVGMDDMGFIIAIGLINLVVVESAKYAVFRHDQLEHLSQKEQQETKEEGAARRARRLVR